MVNQISTPLFTPQTFSPVFLPSSKAQARCLRHKTNQTQIAIAILYKQTTLCQTEKMIPVLEPIAATSEQRFLLPGFYTWEQFQALHILIESGLRISYLDGEIELMTIGQEHEMIKVMLTMLLTLYFLHHHIEFIPAGSATLIDENQGVSFEPDDSYFIGKAKKNPNLALEVVITSGRLTKLEKYKRLGVQEVWFWQKNSIAIYYLEGDNYEQQSQSRLLPNLDLELLVRCVQKDSKLEAIEEFQKGLLGVAQG